VSAGLPVPEGRFEDDKKNRAQTDTVPIFSPFESDFNHSCRSEVALNCASN
jgi:hypothetical protein